jgi:hypothetical protein
VPSFINNIDAVVKSIGAEDVGLVWGLSNVHWASEEERDSFLTEITRSG